MRMAVAMLIGSVWAAVAFAQDARPAKRYGLEADLQTYSQKSPQETLTSVLKAVENKRLDYLLAHLADPVFVDERVKKFHNGDFDTLVRETTDKFAADPGAIKKLQLFQDDGTWKVDGAKAIGTAKGLREHVYMTKINGRWFLENHDRPSGDGKGK
jgi:hypothetical protein